MVVFVGFVLFSLAFVGLQQLRDPAATWSAAVHRHPALAIAMTIAQISAAAAFLAVAIGAAPILLSTRANIDARAVRLARLPAVLALFAMTTGVAATFVLLALTRADTPQLLSTWELLMVATAMTTGPAIALAARRRLSRHPT